MLTVLRGLAELEGKPICARTAEGLRRAVVRGAKLGRESKFTPQKVNEAPRHRDAYEAAREIVRGCNVSHSMISKLAA